MSEKYMKEYYEVYNFQFTVSHRAKKKLRVCSVHGPAVWQKSGRTFSISVRHLCLDQGDHLVQDLDVLAEGLPDALGGVHPPTLPPPAHPGTSLYSLLSTIPHSSLPPPHYITPAPLTAPNPGPQLTPPFSGRACALPLFCDVTLTIDISAGRRAAAHNTALHHSLKSLTTQSSSLAHCLLATGEAGRLISWSGRAKTSF